MADITKPMLTALDLPATIELDVGSPVTLAVRASDAESGVRQVTLHFDQYFPLLQNGTQQYTNSVTFSASTPGAGNSTLSTSIAFASRSLPLGATSLSVKVVSAEVVDAAGNSASYAGADLQAAGLASGFTLQDTTAPRLTSLTIPPFVQLTSSATQFGGSYRVAENGSLLDRIDIHLDRPITLFETSIGSLRGGRSAVVTSDTITLYAPTEEHAFDPNNYLSPRRGEENSGGYGLAVTGADQGVYTVTGVSLADRSGNRTDYSAGQLAALGVATSFTVLPDTTAPILTALVVPTASPLIGDAFVSIDAAKAPAVLGLGITDPAVGYAPSVPLRGVLHLRAPDGSMTDLAVATVDGTYSGKVATGIASLTQAGVYRIAGVTVSDTLGNATDYSMADLSGMGFATSFTVLQAGDAGAVQPTGFYALKGTVGPDTIQLNGNVGDYTLSRGNLDFFSNNQTNGQLGDFVLTATNGSGVYSIAESIDVVRFRNGQYLALKDLPAYVAGSAALSVGGPQDDRLYQAAASGYEAFSGLGGDDRLYLQGNVQDYTLRAVNAEIEPGRGLGGLELVARNGSGALLLDASIETVFFRNGQYLAYKDIASYVAAAPAVPEDRMYHVLADGLPAGTTRVEGLGNRDDWLLLNGRTDDYILSRDAGGGFLLSGADRTVAIGSIEVVQFGDGRYLAVGDLLAYLKGDATFTRGTTANDILVAGPRGDQFVTGLDNVDNLFLHGNTADYHLRAVDLAATAARPAIHGYELVANNGSGNIYIDSTVEVTHFQNGQYLAFADLPAYISDALS